MPVRFHLGSLQRAGKEHGTVYDTVCAEQCVDGSNIFAGGPEMNASEQRLSER